ncbi:hypothetical protein LJB42_004541 [Komagataella kurtzmanii]|nr:hypothetical protein LJB42_004541 [Komagataella kurtzmanii]
MPILARLCQDPKPWEEKPSLKQITPRSILAGLLIGTIVLTSNFQFGLQTGWVSMMSLPSALLGFAMFKALSKKLSYPFTDVENVFVQSVAVATGTGPLAYGFVGIIPAMEKFMTEEESGLGATLKLSLTQLILWSLGVAFFGVFFAIPLRKEVIIREKLSFPSGSATGTLISVLHNTELYEDGNKIGTDKDNLPSQDSDESCSHDSQSKQGPVRKSNESAGSAAAYSPLNDCTVIESQDLVTLQRVEAYNHNIRSLVSTFSVSSVYTILAFFIPLLRQVPIFGTYLSKNYLWNFQPSPAYIGQGMIMGLPSVSYMLFGSILGWGVLAPLAQKLEWAPGPIDDWKVGGQGWILWISLAVMVSDSVISFLVVTIKSSLNFYHRRYANSDQDSLPLLNSETSSNDEPTNSTNEGNSLHFGDEPTNSSNEDHSQHLTDPISIIEDESNTPDTIEAKDVDEKHLVSTNTATIGVLLSSILCIVLVRYVFSSIVPIYALVTAVILALFLSILAVRALGETDLNPVSGIGKISQLVFALIIPASQPGAVLINLIAGGISEAGAQQAGDLMQDLKTGHLIGASPKAQFVAQMIGSGYSVLLSSIMYKVYDSVYELPGPIFRIPTAIIWIDCARIVNGKGLPPHALKFSVIFGLIFGIVAIIKNVMPKSHKWHKFLVYIPSGVPVGIGIYNIPSFTLARFIGGIVSYFWMTKTRNSHNSKIQMIVFSSGLILGEGVFSVITMILTGLGL